MHIRILTLLVLFGVLVLSVGSDRLYAQTGRHCFAETGFCIEGRIREFWEQNGGLPVFGYPVAPQQQEAVEGQLFQVQWFERNRLELHPEHARPYDVLLGRLGVDRLEREGRAWQTFAKAQPQPGCRFFPETGHNVCGRILETWRANGLEFDGIPGTSEAESLALFGYPLSEEQTELLSNGHDYTVQWFERARFELHPEHAPPYDVLLGLLSQEIRAMNELVTADSTILSLPRATAEQTAAYIINRGTPYTDYSVNLIVSYYWRYAPEVGVDPLIAMAQCLHETANLQSWWSQRPRRNPAGLGVTGETSRSRPPSDQIDVWAWDEEEQLWKKGLSFADWEVAARAHIGRLLAYAIRDEHANATQQALIDEALALRPLNNSYRGVAPTMRGLNGRWAYPGTSYADLIAKWANAIQKQ